MHRIIAALVALAAAGTAFGLPVPFWTASALHGDGTGFVAGADVRAATGWDGPALQANAASLEFVAETRSVTTISWQCVQGAGADVVTRHTDLVATASRRIESEPAAWWGTVLGFRLQGFGSGASNAVPEGPAPNSCPTGPWAPVPGSTQTTEEADRSVLTVVHTGERYALDVR